MNPIPKLHSAATGIARPLSKGVLLFALIALLASMTFVCAGSFQNAKAYAITAKTSATKPSKAVVAKLSSTSPGKVTVKIKKVKRASGYQARASYSKKFAKKDTRTIAAKKAVITFKGMKQGKVLYVGARAYVKVKGKKYYGPWSATKKVKVAKASAASGSPAGGGSNAAGAQPGSSFKGYTFPQMTPQDLPVTYQEIQMRTDYMKANGYYGDHSQWPTGLEWSRDGKLALMGTDCAGIYRSIDGGKTWEQSNYGFNSRSSGSFAIDPYSSNHALAISGARSTDGMKYCGIYQTTDCAETWHQMNDIPIDGERYMRDCFEFDPTTYDAAQGITTDAYFSIPWLREAKPEKADIRHTWPKPFITEDQAGLYKTSDGGNTFQLVGKDVHLADGIVKFTASGDLYVGNEYGLFRVNKSTYQIEGSFFENFDIDTTIDWVDDWGYTRKVLKFNMGVTGFDIVGNTLYVQTWYGIYKSKVARPASDADFEKITIDANYSRNWSQHLAVSPVNPDHMVIMTKGWITMYYNDYLNYSLDGGKTWTRSECNRDTIFSSPHEWNSIEHISAWSPLDENTLLANGNGVTCISHDAGANFVQTNGISNLMSGGRFQLNYYNPDIITFGAQDFGGAISTNGGDTWKNLYGRKNNTDTGKDDETRSLYGAFSPDGQTVIAWGADTSKDTFTLMVSFEGGAGTKNTWVDTGLTTDVRFAHGHSVLQSYNNPDIILANEYRSTDRGRTWKKMDSCLAAYTVNYVGAHEIYGINKEGKPVASYDDGASWKVLYNGEKLTDWPYCIAGTEQPIDMAYDQVHNILYILNRYNTQYPNGPVNYGRTDIVKLPLDDASKKKTIKPQKVAGYDNIRTIAIDPNCTSVLYVGTVADNIVNPTSLLRSIDGGETFTNLSRTLFTKDDGTVVENKALNQGGYEVAVMRVDPLTGRVYIGTGCYGFETINPPYDSSLLKHERPR